MFSLITKLVEIFERRWNERTLSRPKLVRAITTLHSNLTACHDAYCAFRDEPDELTARRWAGSLDSLVVALASLDATLGFFAPDLRAELSRYVQSERRLYSSAAIDIAAAAAAELAYVVGEQDTPYNNLFEKAVTRPEELNAAEDFEAPINRLGEFIRANFTMEEIFGRISGK